MKRCVIVLMLSSILAGPVAAKREYSQESFEACVQCHETDKVMGIADTAHADFEDPDSPAAQKQCQSCHGPSAVHMDFPMQVENVHFGSKSSTAARVQNQMCLECHESNGRGAWSASAHGYEDVLCSRCHSAHDPDAIVPRSAAATATCTGSCHLDLMKESQPTDFSHPVGESLEGGETITCASCHDPHVPLGSARCVDCHEQSAEVLARESEKARRFHEVAAKKGTECIRCHKGVAHPIPPLALQESRVHTGPALSLGVR